MASLWYFVYIVVKKLKKVDNRVGNRKNPITGRRGSAGTNDWNKNSKRQLFPYP